MEQGSAEQGTRGRVCVPMSQRLMADVDLAEERILRELEGGPVPSPSVMQFVGEEQVVPMVPSAFPNTPLVFASMGAYISLI